MTDWSRFGPFTNGQLPAVNDDFLNNVEEGVDLAHEEIEALAALVAQKIGLPTSPTTGDLLTFNGTTWVASPPAEAGGVPVGTVIWRASVNTPDGYLPVDGAAVSRTTYADLFAEVGTTHGVGDGSTTFNVPNAKKRVFVCLDPSNTNFDTMGETGGEETHTLTEAELAVHDHAVTDPGHAHSISGQFISGEGNNVAVTSGSWPAGSGTNAATTGISVGNAGSGSAHNNLQPYLVLSAFIKY